MVAYRFCRPDDIPRLVEAVRVCVGPHLPRWKDLDVDRFRREMKVLDVWPSNSMVATEADEPIAVVIGTKRTREVLVRVVGVRPGRERQGHGRHLLDSLARKLAVLGPPRLVAEVPDDCPRAQSFFRAIGYREVECLVDLVLEEATGRAPPPELFATVPASEIDLGTAIGEPTRASWDRQPESLRQLGDEGRATVLHSPDGIEVWALTIGHPEGGLDLLALGDRFRPPRARLLAALLQHLTMGSRKPLRVPRVAAEADLRPTLEALGFLPERGSRRFGLEIEPT